MKKYIVFFLLFIISSLSASAGQPYYGAETGIGFNNSSDVMWTVGGIVGYNLPAGDGFSFAPELMLGYAMVHSDTRMLGENQYHPGVRIFENLSSFLGSVRANFNFRLYKNWGLYIAPNVNFMAGDADARHWNLSLLAGLKYDFKPFTLRLSYNQEVTRLFDIRRINPITIGFIFRF